MKYLGLPVLGRPHHQDGQIALRNWITVFESWLIRSYPRTQTLNLA